MSCISRHTDISSIRPARLARDGSPYHRHISLFRLLALFLRRWFAPKVRSFARIGVQGMAARAGEVTRFVNQILQVAERHFSRTRSPNGPKNQPGGKTPTPFKTSEKNF